MKNITEKLESIADILHDAEHRFISAGLHFGHGTDNAWDDAVAIVRYVLHLPVDVDESIGERHLDHTERQKILSLIDQRIKVRIPVPYLTHEAWFAGLPFYIDERVIIPRSPFAELIQNHFVPWVSDVNAINHILDLCTGSGCIGIACAFAFPKASIDAVDIDSATLDVAELNVSKYELIGRVNLIESDLFQALPKKQYDIIISNPPYVSDANVKALPEEYHHEPGHALSSGADGLFHVKQILQQAADYLTDEGILLVEVGCAQPALEKAFPSFSFIWLEFEYGGEGVFLLSKKDLIKYEAFLT